MVIAVASIRVRTPRRKTTDQNSMEKDMTTAIIGIGNIGGTVARALATGGEQVMLSATRPDEVQRLADEIGAGATAARDNRDAVRRADAVVLALWLDPMQAVVKEIADLLPGKLVIDPSNPISVGADGTIARTLPDGQSAGVVVGGWLPEGTRFAKAFGTLSQQLLSSGANRTPDRAVLFYATDDPATATEVERLIRIAGFDAVQAGRVSDSGRIEVGGDLHAFGGLNGRLVDVEEAQTLVGAAGQARREGAISGA
jgi:predicted dinucleotide-binding enzyme